MTETVVDKSKRLNKAIAKAKAAGELDTNLISDGYHDFGTLYAHRIELFITLCRVLAFGVPGGAYAAVWRSQVDDDWFILGLGDQKGEQMSYHLPMEKWAECGFAMYKAPNWDGHTSEDVLVRLRAL